MDEPTCIVCLGELATSPSDTAATTSPGGTAASSPNDGTNPKVEASPGTVAHLLPCGHDLHNDCLQPWVERANSCPICRTNFHEVELKAFRSGPTLSSYEVHEKIQVAELDRATIASLNAAAIASLNEPTAAQFDISDVAPPQPCIMCDEPGNSGNLLLCDGCSNCCHTHCAGLLRVPAGLWFCQFCHQDGAANLNSSHVSRNHRPLQHVAWNQVWSQVYAGANIDLDFPFANRSRSSSSRPASRTEARQNEFDDWQRRFDQAEHAGAAARFRDTLTGVIGAQARARARTQARRSPTPSPESQEELQAWNALDKAKQLQDAANASNNSTRKRNRSTAPASPADRQPSVSQRQLKRPRQRRNQELPDVNVAAANSDTVVGSSRTVPIMAPRPVARHDEGPTFLQSLLDEVKTAPAVNGSGAAGSPDNGNAQTTSASCNTSPAGSPASSTPSSPRMRPTSPSGQRSRPASPPPLTSRVEPEWYISQFSPASPLSPTSRSSSNPAESIAAGYSRGIDRQPENTSPAREGGKRSARAKPITSREKGVLQSMVSEQLRPLSKKHKLNDEQFTDINRTVSRQMYKLVQNSGGLKEEQDAEREKWMAVASTQVKKAVKALVEGGVAA